MDIVISVNFQLDILWKEKLQSASCLETSGNLLLLYLCSALLVSCILKYYSREGVTAVEEAVDCPNVSTIAIKSATIFQEFLQHSHLPVWNRFKNSGFWRQLTVLFCWI